MITKQELFNRLANGDWNIKITPEVLNIFLELFQVAFAAGFKKGREYERKLQKGKEETL